MKFVESIVRFVWNIFYFHFVYFVARIFLYGFRIGKAFSCVQVKRGAFTVELFGFRIRKIGESTAVQDKHLGTRLYNNV